MNPKQPPTLSGGLIDPPRPNHHSFSASLERLTRLVDDFGESLNRAIDIARPHLVFDPRDPRDCTDNGPLAVSAPVPLASPCSQEIRAVNDRLEGLVELLKRFSSNFDT